MKPKEPRDPATTPSASGRLADLVDEELNKSLADQVAEELDRQRQQPVRPSGTSDYAHGTAEHEDEPEA